MESKNLVSYSSYKLLWTLIFSILFITSLIDVKIVDAATKNGTLPSLESSKLSSTSSSTSSASIKAEDKKIPEKKDSSSNKDATTTENLIRDILNNQTKIKTNDELILEELLNSASLSKLTPDTWNRLVKLVNQITNETDNQLNEDDSFLTKKGILNDNYNYNSNTNYDNENNNLTIKKASNLKDRLKSAIDEFPPDFMSNEMRQNGGFLIHIAIFIYLSIVLAVICDNYFLKSLEYISEALHLPSDIAGATFMAIGTSAPELFTSVIGVFISDNDIGTGTIVGSAVFNLIAIPGACGFAAFANLKLMPKINPFPIIRDTIFYVLTIIALILCIKDNRVDWIESITLISLYIVYIIIMYFNAQISHVVNNSQQIPKYKHNGNTNSNQMDKLTSTGTVMTNQRTGSSTTVPKDTSRHMTTTNDILKNNCCFVDSNDETRPLLLTDYSVKRLSPPPAYADNSTEQFNNIPKRQLPHRSKSLSIDPLELAKIRLQKQNEIRILSEKSALNKNNLIPMSMDDNLIDIEDDINPDDLDTDWSDNTIIKFLLFPFTLIFLITLPKPTRFCFVMTFVCSIVWIASLTYFIVWMVTLVGYTLGIPDTVSGITVLAAGTSIPELISSYLIVKKAGLADMAICNSIGSNIFDILFCLGLPWLLKSSIIIVKNGFGLATIAQTFIPIQSTALPITSLTLLLTIGAMMIIFKASRWVLNLQLGILCTIVYVVFVITSTSLELNI